MATTMYRTLGFSYRRHDRLGECIITAWEYATGVDRDVIAAGIGRRGSELSDDAASQKAAGVAVSGQEPANLRGVDDWSGIQWAIDAGYQLRIVIAAEHENNVSPPADLSQIVEVATQARLPDRLRGVVAVVYQTASVEAERHIGHVVAWLGDCVIDPSVSIFQVSTRIDETITRFAVIIEDRDPADAIVDLRRIAEASKNT